MSKRIKTQITIDQMAELLDLKIPFDFMENVDFANTWTEAWQFKLNELSRNHDHEHSADLIDDLAREFADKCEDKERDELYSKYCDAIVRVFETFLIHHNLQLNTFSKKTVKHFIIPVVSWRDAANHILETVNGVGFFYFNSLRDFLDSGPYSPKQAVMSHLHWMKRYSDVYGGYSPQKLLDSFMR